MSISYFKQILLPGFVGFTEFSHDNVVQFDFAPRYGYDMIDKFGTKRTNHYARK